MHLFSRKVMFFFKIWVQENITTELKTVSKSWWWTAGRLAGKGVKSEIPVLKANGNTHTSLQKTRQNVCHPVFCEKSTIPEEDNNKRVPELHSRTSSSCSKVVFWPSKVMKELLKLDINKASGLDNVPALILLLS